MPTDYCLVLTTVDNSAAAENLAAGLLQARLAACIQISAVHSHYRWQGQIQQSPEQQLQIKTRSALFPALRAWLLAQHPYDTPEIVQLAITDGSDTYLSWLSAETSGPSKG